MKTLEFLKLDYNIIFLRN